MPKKGPFVVAPLDGTFFAPGREPINMPDMEVKYFPKEYIDTDKTTPRNRLGNLVRQLANTFKKNNVKEK